MCGCDGTRAPGGNSDPVVCPSGPDRKVPPLSVSVTREETQWEEAECGCGASLSWSYPRAFK